MAPIFDDYPIYYYYLMYANEVETKITWDKKLTTTSI